MKITEKELKELIKDIVLEAHSKADEKTLKKMAKKLRSSSKMHGQQSKDLEGSSKLHADQADELEDIVDRSDDEELKEGEEQVTENLNCGCNQDPCITFGVISIEEAKKIIQKEIQADLDEVQYYGRYEDEKPYHDRYGKYDPDQKYGIHMYNPEFLDMMAKQIKDSEAKERLRKKLQQHRDEVAREFEEEGEVMPPDYFDNNPYLEQKLRKIVKEEIQADLDEAKKKKTDKERMKCNSPRRIRKGEAGHGTKKFVVKACKDGKEKIIRYGDANLEIKKDSPKRRKSFRARHKCDTAKDKMSARYWSCKKW